VTAAFTNDPVLLEWCENLIAKGKFEDAEKFAHVLYETKEHPALLMLARALDANGKSKKATKLLTNFFRQLYISLHVYLDEIGRY